jgi:isoamylase
MHFALNAYWEPLEFELPVLENHANGGWRRLIDSSRPSPHDLVDLAAAERVTGTTHRVEPHAVVMLVAAVRPNHATP